MAYGDSSKDPGGCVIHDDPCPPGHVDLDRLVATIWDPAQDVQQSRSDFLNQITHASDSWISSPEWAAREDLSTSVQPGDTIVLGFDGSKGRNRARRTRPRWSGSGVRRSRSRPRFVGVGAAFRARWPGLGAGRVRGRCAVRSAFETYRVVGFYADPSGWTEHVAKWRRRSVGG